MVVSEFIERVEETWGAYRSGMRAVVEQRLRGTDWQSLVDLFRAVADEHTHGGAPAWGVIHRIARESGIRLGLASRLKYESECEFCHSRFPMEEPVCGRCGKKRKFGRVARIPIG